MNLLKKELLINVGCGIFLILNMVQTYVTIDPVIINYCKRIDTGEKQIYRLAYNGDDRAGMNLGTEVDEDYALICDIYSYNNEYSFYEGLIDDFYRDMVTEEISVYTLNISPYEINLAGRGYGSYNIYWDLEHQRRTFIYDEKTTILLYPQVIYDQFMDQYDLSDEFLVIVPGRIDSSEYEAKMSEKGYECTQKKQYRNVYGSMTAFRYKKAST
jgi:hypothetical protein